MQQTGLCVCVCVGGGDDRMKHIETGTAGSDFCSDITNDQLGISGETGHGGANLYIY